MKLLFAILLACSIPLVSRSEDRIINEISFPRTDVRSVLSFYERLTGKPVLVPLVGFEALVTIESTESISRQAAIDLIRKTLLERYGIELRTSDRGETLATWSQDPQYPHRSDEPMTEAERNALPKSKVRIIRPAGDR